MSFTKWYTKLHMQVMFRRRFQWLALTIMSWGCFFPMKPDLRSRTGVVLLLPTKDFAMWYTKWGMQVMPPWRSLQAGTHIAIQAPFCLEKFSYECTNSPRSSSIWRQSHIQAYANSQSVVSDLHRFAIPMVRAMRVRPKQASRHVVTATANFVWGASTGMISIHRLQVTLSCSTCRHSAPHIEHADCHLDHQDNHHRTSPQSSDYARIDYAGVNCLQFPLLKSAYGRKSLLTL